MPKPTKLISVSVCRHSGTTLTATVLGAHANALLIPIETGMFLTEEYKFEKIIQNYKTKKFDMVIEKTPNHIYVIDKIKKLHPETKFIANIRDPRDIAASLYKRFHDWSMVMDRLTKDFESIINFQEHLYVVKYENIVHNFEETFHKICKYLDIEFDEKMLNFHEYAPNWFGVVNPEKTNGTNFDKLHESNRAWQVKQPLFDGTGRWKKDLNSNHLKDLQRKGEIFQIFGYSI
jgi:hypothetical protein